ncbi:S-adenosyl-L-methionine-dependent methyltransferase [Xylariaceae sp. FL0662B]|nr:S-adenosyl-L-methionine-dependent methyltransferase [Xylariaceae sp. FL0662B]
MIATTVPDVPCIHKKDLRLPISEESFAELRADRHVQEVLVLVHAGTGFGSPTNRMKPSERLQASSSRPRNYMYCIFPARHNNISNQTMPPLRPHSKPARKPKKKPPAPNPIEAAIRSWFSSNPLLPPAPPGSSPPARPDEPGLDDLLAQAPRRWTVYEPLVLLPAGSFSSAQWAALLRSVGSQAEAALWRGILAAIGVRTGAGAGARAPLTHLAANEGIPARLDTDADNVLRAPSGLRMLHGDFGPPPAAAASSEEADFARAFWVATRQNGIVQTWAPRWTMFSRGNVKEKARLLGFHHASRRGRAPPPGNGTHDDDDDDDDDDGQRNSNYNNDDRVRLSALSSPPASLRDKYAVDLYAGIGYFVFSYARLGMHVLCWELNPWSVEGLRRGARANGWTVRVVKGEDELRLPMGELLAGGEQIVVFLEDNRHAARRIRELRGEGTVTRVDVLHVNCGLLPTSDASWGDAWDIVGGGDESWLHLHENVGVADIKQRREDIEQWFLNLSRKDERGRAAHVEHVELVKTFAPGVWHCVFDLHITKSSSIT